jgi:thiol:disulfide interchange protein DsbD
MPAPPRQAERGIERLRRIGVVAAAATLLGTTVATGADPELLPPERAFRFSVRGLDPTTIEARFAIVDGYYMYRDKLKFALAPGTLAAQPSLPPGKVKDDPFFGPVETYRGEVVVRLALATAAPGSKVTVTAESQGCADIGVCYPPQRQNLSVALPPAGAGPGAPVEATPARKSWFN